MNDKKRMLINMIQHSFTKFYALKKHFYFLISLTTCASSGSINFSMASLTAPVDPGMEKMAVFEFVPAIALDMNAAEPISLV